MTDTKQPRHIELTAEEERQQEAAIERVLDDVHHGRQERHAAQPVDPLEVAANEAEIIRGRSLDHEPWRQVMEYYGYCWLVAEEVDRLVGPEKYIPSKFEGIHDRYGRDVHNTNLYWTRKRTDGQWRFVPGSNKLPHPAMRGYSFTMKDLVGLYGTPEEFDKWAREMIRRWCVKRSSVRRR